MFQVLLLLKLNRLLQVQSGLSKGLIILNSPSTVDLELDPGKVQRKLEPEFHPVVENSLAALDPVVSVRGHDLILLVEARCLHASLNIEFVDVAAIGVVDAQDLVDDQSDFILFVLLLELLGLLVVPLLEIGLCEHFGNQL